MNTRERMRPILVDQLLNVEDASPEDLELIQDGYSRSAVLDMVMHQDRLGIPRTAVLSDLEGSLWLRKLKKHAFFLEQVLCEHHIPLPIITGFSFEQIYELIEQGEVPRAPILGTSSGPEVYVLQKDGTYRNDLYYRKEVLQAVPWDRRTILERGIEMFDDLHRRVPEFRLEWKDREKEMRFLRNESDEVDPERLCFYFYADSIEKRDHFERAAQVFFPECSVIVTYERSNDDLPDGTKELKYCLDINHLDKKHIAAYLKRLLGLEQGAVVGDAGNDKGMLLLTDFITIVPGSGREELRSAIDAATTHRQGKRFRRIRTSDGNEKDAYVEKDTNRKAAVSLIRVLPKVISLFIEQSHNMTPAQLQYWQSVRHDLLRRN